MDKGKLIKPIRNWGIERQEYRDELTGRRVWQLTNHKAPSAHFYFTRSSWIKGWPRPFFVSDRNGTPNLYTFDGDWSVLQLTDMPAVEGAKYWTSYDGKTFFRCHHCGPGLLSAQADSLGEGIYFSSGFEDQHLMHYDFETGAVECLFEHAAGCITSDGKYSLSVMKEDDYKKKLRHSKLYQINLSTGKREFICEDDGDFAHMLCSPVDPELVIWINYLTRKGTKFNPRTKELGTWIDYSKSYPENVYYHYSFLPGSSLILTAHRGTEPCPVKPHLRQAVWTIQNEKGEVLNHLEEWNFLSIAHATVSHNHSYCVGDTFRHNTYSNFKPGDVKNEIHLFDCNTGRTSIFCTCNSSFISRDEKGEQHVYCEYLHPRPVFSPDDRYVLFDSDFCSFTSQVYMVEV